MGTTITNQNCIQEEIKSRLKSANACCHAVQNLLSFSLVSQNVKIKIYRTIVLPVVLYGCGTWSLILREERRLRVFENRVLRRIQGGSNMTGTDLCVNKSQFVPVIFEPPCIWVQEGRGNRGVEKTT